MRQEGRIWVCDECYGSYDPGFAPGAAGLRMVPTPRRSAERWLLTHWSGAALARVGRAADVPAIAQALAPLTDWTAPAEQLLATSGLAGRVARALSTTPGVMVTSRPGVTA
ncbi:hypothetical protein ACIQU6_41615 [Streptomyces sp. NPDC090442]|uniref:hypothetical protein n=1 Tax=Streptomyces sp. NPDC090442 TaxID=3365962 RepID=UPI0038190F35